MLRPLRRHGSGAFFIKKYSQNGGRMHRFLPAVTNAEDTACNKAIMETARRLHSIALVEKDLIQTNAAESSFSKKPSAACIAFHAIAMVCKAQPVSRVLLKMAIYLSAKSPMRLSDTAGTGRAALCVPYILHRMGFT